MLISLFIWYQPFDKQGTMAVVKSQLEHLCSTFNIESAESIGLQMQSYIEEVRPTKKNNTHLHLDRNSFRLGPFN